MTKHTVLFLAANPPDAARRALEQEARSIRFELKGSGYRERFVFEPRWAMEALDLLRELREVKPAVLHFAGHGGKHALLLQDAQGGHRSLAPEVIAETLVASGAPLKLIVLSACHSEATARALLAHFDFVVGSNGSLADKAARNFAIGFYGGLGEQASIAAAYRQGCAAIGLESPSDPARPQLLVRGGADADQTVLAADVTRLQEPPCPYPGMRPYTADDAEGFCGRRQEIDELLARLRAGEREIYVVGPSGSGKSSLVAAGLLPALARGVAGLGPFVVRSMRPGAKPAARLQELLEAPAEATSPAALLAALLAHRGPKVQVMIVIDQLEELFTLASISERKQLSIALQALRSHERCVVVATLRADFFGAFMESSLWTDRDAPLFSNRRGRISYIEVSPLTGAALREAISDPARALEVSVETELIDQLLDDAADEPGSLPLLQETLLQLWEGRQAGGLALAGYRALGEGKRSGLAVTLSRRADATLRPLTPAQVVIARRIFLRLINFGDDRLYTRRQQARSSLASVGDVSADFQLVLETLVAHRLLTIDEEIAEDDAHDDPSVDLAHEVMISAWPTLADWVHTHSPDEQRRRELETRADYWVKHGRGRRGMLDLLEVRDAVAWQATTSARDLGESADVTALITWSGGWHKKQTTLRRVAIFSVLVALLVVILVVTKLAITANREASNTERMLAQSYQDTGRQLLVDDHPEQAVPYLLAARAKGEVNVPLRMLFGMAARRLPLVPPLEHRGGVVAAEFSPDGTRVVTASTDHSARVWNSATGEPVTAALKHGELVTRAVFSPDGTRVATASKDHTARIWNATTGEPITHSLQHDGPVSDIAFSPDGSRVVTTSSLLVRTAVRVWDAATGNPLGDPSTYLGTVSVAFTTDGPRVLARSVDQKVWGAKTENPTTVGGDTGTVTSAAFSPDGTRVVTVSRDHIARVYDIIPGARVIATFAHPDEDLVRAAFSRDGRRVVTTTANGAVHVWDVTTQAKLAGLLPLAAATLSPDLDPVARLSPDGARIVTAIAERTARVWDATTGNPATAPLEHSQRVNGAVFSPDGGRVLTASADHVARIWDAAMGPRAVALPYLGLVLSASFTPDCTRVVVAASATPPAAARVWDTMTGTPLTPPLEHQLHVTFAVFSRDGNRIVTGSWDGTAKIWDAATGKGLASLQHKLTVAIAAFSPDRARVVTASGDIARVWDTASGRLLASTPRHDSPLSDVAFSPDGRRIATASRDRTARIWDAVTGAAITPPLIHEQEVNSVEFSADGSRVVTASNDDSARVWDATTGSPLFAPVRHEGSVLHATFNPQGTRIVTTSADQTARIWDAATGKAIASPLPHTGVTSATFSPDGTRIATAGQETARIWDADNGKPLTSVLQHEKGVVSMVFCADGRRFATASRDGTIHIWDVAPDGGTYDEWAAMAKRSPFFLKDGVLVRRDLSAQ